MKPSTRWTIAVVAVIVIAIILLLLFRRSEPEAPAKSEVATQPPAPTAEPYAPAKHVAGGRVRIEDKGEAEPVTGEACKNMGPENHSNLKLINCLQHDRRVEVRLVARP